MKRVLVFTDHTHNGILYPAGTWVDLPDDVADWLVGAERARRADVIRAYKPADVSREAKADT